ncbi:MAG TPA: PAS domain S-box protein [Chthoniobacterales bacterium]
MNQEVMQLYPAPGLLKTEVSFSALARVAPVGILRFDAGGRCNYVNDRWTDLTGLTTSEAIGDGWQRAIHPEDRAAVIERWRQLRDSDDVFLEEYRISRPDGAVRWVLAEGVALRGQAAETLGFIRAITDITNHRRLEEELSAARVELEDRVRERTAKLETEMEERANLEKEVLESRLHERRRFSQDLHDGLGQSLTGILFRALALQRDLEAEGSKHAAKATTIGELVNEAINQAHNLARGIQPVSARPEGLVCALEELTDQLRRSQVADCAFLCDRSVRINDHDAATHLYRIAQEALHNAIKHSGVRRMTLHLAPGCLVVRDEGRGQATDGSPRGGRGLNIMRHRARLIDATLRVTSAPGGGTTVECRFPSQLLLASDEP